MEWNLVKGAEEHFICKFLAKERADEWLSSQIKGGYFDDCRIKQIHEFADEEGQYVLF